MTIDEIYDTALYLAEKTDDDTGYIDSEYKNQHKKKAELLIRQSIRKYAYLENISMTDVDRFKTDEDIPLPSFILKNVIPYYIGAILCCHDMESEKYNVLIHEYQEAINQIKHDEQIMDFCDILQEME